MERSDMMPRERHPEGECGGIRQFLTHGVELQVRSELRIRKNSFEQPL